MSTPRTYELRERAERQAETRQRIVEAAVELHTTLGPARTTVKAIAERAGVTRPTVYAHFPDTRSIFEACSGHVAATVPFPDPAVWQQVPDPGGQLATALHELFLYYARLEPLLENLERDVVVMPLVAEFYAETVRYLEQVRDGLLDAWGTSGRTRTRVRGAIGHALEFRTWQSLVRHQGLRPADAVALLVDLVRVSSQGMAPL